MSERRRVRKAELVVGDAYVVRWQRGPQTLASLTYPGRKGSVAFEGQRPGTTYRVPLADIEARWDDPAQVAKREQEAANERANARARVLLRTLGLTVAQPGRMRRLGSGEPEPQSWTQGQNAGSVVINRDAFLGLFDVPGLAAIAAQLGDPDSRQEAG